MRSLCIITPYCEASILESDFSFKPAAMAVNAVPLATFFFLLIVSSSFTFALHFNFSPITTAYNDKIKIPEPGTNGAYISLGIQVTPDERSRALPHNVGRAVYVEPLHLWDKATGNLADFSTHFTFVIDSRGKPDYADGLAFFLAPTNSTISRKSAGGCLGLVDAAKKKTTERFVAVEFDTYTNPWDTIEYYPYTHVGIDINNMTSVNATPWFSNISAGFLNEAWVSYNATSKNLEVVFTDFPTTEIENSSLKILSYVVDLRDYLPEWVIFGFSAATGDSFQTNNVKSWDFSSTLQVASNPPEPSPSPRAEHIPIVDDPRKKKKGAGLAIGISSGSAFLILGLATLCYVLWRRSKKRRNDFPEISMDNEFEKGNGPKKYSYTVLVQATNNFAEGEKLGEGGFGGVYKGFLRDENIYIAVKKVSRASKQGLKEYASEVKIISKLRHRNLVQLRGWCHEGGELLLVYEFMPKGSLDSHLFKADAVLNWATRYKIAQGLASALLYLHEEWDQCVVHRDIKSSNVMLDSSFNAKLGDFGLARLVDHEKGSQTTNLAGTIGYMAPECCITGRSSKESDVYSFGIVALEIACGKRPTLLVAKSDCIRTVEWAWELYGRGELLEAADPKLATDFDKQEMERLITVGLWCAHPDSNLRPTIKQARHVLSFEAEVPVLPEKMPMPTYSAPPALNSTKVSMTDDLKSFGYTFSTDSSNVTSTSGASGHSSSHLLTR